MGLARLLVGKMGIGAVDALVQNNASWRLVTDLVTLGDLAVIDFLKYFDRDAYLAQSPQFYKQAGMSVFERVFEIGNRPINFRHRLRRGSVRVVELFPFGEDRAALETRWGFWWCHHSGFPACSSRSGRGWFMARANVVANGDAHRRHERGSDEESFRVVHGGEKGYG